MGRGFQGYCGYCWKWGHRAQSAGPNSGRPGTARTGPAQWTLDRPRRRRRRRSLWRSTSTMKGKWSRTRISQLKRLGRYLLDKSRVIVCFAYQEALEAIDVWIDTDHVGCLATRKSTSGGVIMYGSHCLKTWSVNQQVIAMSSGDAQYYGMVGCSQCSWSFGHAQRHRCCSANLVVHRL